MKNNNTRKPEININAANEGEEATIPINGYQQVIEMLKIADPEFRDSLLKRLAQRDVALARALRDQI